MDRPPGSTRGRCDDWLPTRWVRPDFKAEDPERLAIGRPWPSARLSTTAAPPSAYVTDLAGRAGMTADEIECWKKAAPNPP